jgi:hypothetical protein
MMKIRLVLGFAALIIFALIQPGSVYGGGLERAFAQSTPSTPTVLGVVRNQGATLHDRPDGEPMQRLVGGMLVTVLLRSTDLQWVLVKTRDLTEGWVEVSTLLAAGLGRLPVEVPTPTPTLSPTPTLTPTPTVEADSEEVMEVTGTVTPEPMAEASGTPDASMESATSVPTGEAMSEQETPQPNDGATPEAATAVAMPEPTPTPFVPPEGPTALSLARIGGAVLWDGEDGAFVAHFRAGSRLTAAYRTEDSSWYFVYGDNGIHGWALAEELLVVSGDSLAIEEFTIPGEEITPIAEEETPTATPTPAGPTEKVVVTVNSFGQRLNVRAGPSTTYDIVAKAVAGVTFNGIGRTAAGDWIKVAIADLPSGYGWVSATYVTTSGQFEELPVEEGMEMSDG